MKNNDEYIDVILDMAIEEDGHDVGDITTKSIFEKTECAEALIRSKGSGVVSGCYLIAPLFKKLDPHIEIDCFVSDGDPLVPGTHIAKIKGSIHAILTGERIILNFLQRLSGIATQTSFLVKKISHTDCKLLDTRKTAPVLRLFEKKAVVHGGGVNHRFGLYDMVLIKDTHVKAAGGVAQAIERVKHTLGTDRGIKIEAEVQSVDEFRSAVEASPDIIMLDNMSVDDMKKCVHDIRSVKSNIQLEASGNVSAETIAAIAESGVDYISVGSVTHSVQALDIHLKIL